MGGLAASVLLVTTQALAQDDTRPWDKEIHRTWGLGAALGGGAGAVTVRSSTGSAGSGVFPMLYLPTLEAAFFVSPSVDVRVSIPIANNAISSIAVLGFAWTTDVFVDFYMSRKGIARLFLGPGLGFSVVASGAGGGALRIPAELGLELLTTGQHFGFQILARPWVEFGGASGSGQSASAVAGGVVGMLAFIGYFTND